jgi:hypothetical protein
MIGANSVEQGFFIDMVDLAIPVLICLLQPPECSRILLPGLIFEAAKDYQRLPLVAASGVGIAEGPHNQRIALHCFVERLCRSSRGAASH